jgi:hypothetical protein
MSVFWFCLFNKIDNLIWLPILHGYIQHVMNQLQPTYLNRCRQ